MTDSKGTSSGSAYLVFAIVATALLMSSIDSTVVAVGLSTMMQELNTNLAWIGWTLTGYQLAHTVIMPIAGKLSDELGRKRVFLGAVVMFTLTSMATALAPNVYWLILFRVLQGISGGSFMPTATGIVGDAFGAKRRAAAIGLFGSIFPIGGILGPNIGGFIIDHYSWRWIFLVNVPLGIVLLIVGLIALKKTEPVKGKRLDIVGASLFGSMLLALLYALTTWADNPEGGNFLAWPFFAAAAALLFLFIRHEGRATDPAIELELLTRRPFIAVNVYNFFIGAVAFSFFSFIPYYSMVAYGMTAGESGLILTPRSFAIMGMSALCSLFIIRFRYRTPMIIGIILLSASMFLLSQGYHDVTIFGWYIPDIALLTILVMIGGFGLGTANPAANNAALDLIPEKISAAAGMRGMFRSTGGVIGTAILVLALSHFQDKAYGLQVIFFTFGLVVALVIPVVFLIPDTARQRYVAAHNGHTEKTPNGT